MPWTPWESAAAGAETVDLIAGEAIAAGQLVYQNHGASGTQGRVYLTDSDFDYASNKAAVIGIATTGAESAGSTVTVQYTGVATVSSTLVADRVYSPSSTPGELAANGEEPMIGVAESTSELRLTGVVSGLSGLTSGVAYGADSSGVLTSGQSESIGYAISATELLIRMEYGATQPQGLGDLLYQMGGENGSSSRTSDVDRITITSLAVSANWSNISAAKYALAGLGSDTRIVAAGGTTSNAAAGTNVLDYVDPGSGSAFADFGDLTQAVSQVAAASNSTVGLIAIGRATSGGGLNVVNKITTATTGNATDAADLQTARFAASAVASPTRFYVGGGYEGSSYVDTIGFTSFASVANLADAGDLQSTGAYSGGGCGSATRGLIAGVWNGALIATINAIDLASTAGGTDFGDLTAGRRSHGAVGSNRTRGMWGGGYDSSAAYTDDIQTVVIASASDSTVQSELLSSNLVAGGSHSTGNGGLQ